MVSSKRFIVGATMVGSLSHAYPATSGRPSVSDINDPGYGPIPGESSVYSEDREVIGPFPADFTGSIPPTHHGAAGPDDLLFQNLLAAEWIIYSFYQQGVEEFTPANFTEEGYPSSTYARIQEIRDNEAGHLRIFQDSISTTSIKPGSCRYEFPIHNNVTQFLALSTVIEISSMVFLSGLVQQSRTQATSAALLAISNTETRHETWSLIDIWGANPFAGSSDTVFPYANQVLDYTNEFIVPGSCAAGNPMYPSPRQHLPQLAYEAKTMSLLPGSTTTFTYANTSHVPAFEPEKDYYAVFFHGLYNISMPFNTKTRSTVIPQDFEQKGIIVAVVADEKGAPTEQSVVAGPLLLVEYPLGIMSLV